MPQCIFGTLVIQILIFISIISCVNTGERKDSRKEHRNRGKHGQHRKHGRPRQKIRFMMPIISHMQVLSYQESGCTCSSDPVANFRRAMHKFLVSSFSLFWTRSNPAEEPAGAGIVLTAVFYIHKPNAKFFYQRSE